MFVVVFMYLFIYVLPLEFVQDSWYCAIPSGVQSVTVGSVLCIIVYSVVMVSIM